MLLCHTSYPILSQFVNPCPVLNVASCPAYRFLRRQVRWSGIPSSWRIFPQFVVIYTVKGLVESMKQMIFWKSLAFSMIQQILTIWSLVPLLYLNWACISGSSLPSLKDFEHYLVSKWKECNCKVVWTFFGIVLLWDWNKNWPFPVLWPLLSFPNLLTYWV